MVAWVFAGCNKETYIESIGYVMLESGDDADVGYFIFTSGKAVEKCGTVTIFIDDKNVGQLTSDHSTSITCSTVPVDGKILKVVAGTGNHKISVSVKDGCKEYTSQNYNLEKGKCMWYTIN